MNSKITDRLKKSKGFGSLKISRRRPAKKRRPCHTLDQQEKAARATMDAGKMDMQEEIIFLFLTEEQELIAGYPMYRGTVDACGFDTAELIQAAAIAGAQEVVMVHNHPSGVVLPSTADVSQASTLGHALQIAGFNLLDFIVLTRDERYSLEENGLLYR